MMSEQLNMFPRPYRIEQVGFNYFYGRDVDLMRNGKIFRCFVAEFQFPNEREALAWRNGRQNGTENNS